MVEITNKGNTCKDCPFRTHSGAFTKGGAQEICQHKQAVGISRGEIPAEHKTDLYGKPRDPQLAPYHWYHRRIGTGTPSPDWCPLKTPELQEEKMTDVIYPRI